MNYCRMAAEQREVGRQDDDLPHELSSSFGSIIWLGITFNICPASAQRVSYSSQYAVGDDNIDNRDFSSTY